MKLSNNVLRWCLVVSSMLLLLLVSSAVGANNTTTDAATKGPEMTTSFVTPLNTDAPTTANKTEPKTTQKSVTTPAKKKSTTQAAASTLKPGSQSDGIGVAGVFCIIVLIVCLIGIGFCGYQFYRKRQNDDYHTL